MTAPQRPSDCLFVQTKSELGTAIELAAAVQRCGARDMGKFGINEICPWCIEAVRAVMMRSTPTQREIVERWMHLPATD